MIRLTVNTAAAKSKLNKIVAGLDPKKVQRIVERRAAIGISELAKASPRRYFGQLQGGWRMGKAKEGVLIHIPPNLRGPTGQKVADILLWVNNGTANDGQGYIYPKTKKFLYIPLNRSAALGWREGLERGRDYVLAPRVKGIKGRHFVEPVRDKIRADLKEDLKDYIRQLIQAK